MTRLACQGLVAKMSLRVTTSMTKSTYASLVSLFAAYVGAPVICTSSGYRSTDEVT
jgi:hypothetical protein